MASNTDSHQEPAPLSSEPGTGPEAEEQAPAPAPAPAEAQTTGVSELATDAESQRIDGLLERYLALLDEYAALRARLSDLQAAVFRDLARANFASADRGVRYYGSDYYDERMQALRRVRVVRVPPMRGDCSGAGTGEGAGGGAGGGREGGSEDLALESSTDGAEKAEAAGEAGIRTDKEGGKAVNNTSGGADEGGRKRGGGEEKRGHTWTGPVFSVEVYPPPGGEPEGSEDAVKSPGQEELGANGEGVSGSVEEKGEAHDDGGGKGTRNEMDSGASGSTTTTTTPEQGDEETKKKPKQRPIDPLRWFGILTPLPLRQAQSHSIKVVEEIIPRLATLNAEMAEVELEVRRARKRRAKAAKAEEKRLAELGEKMAKVNISASAT
ncbi:hypothetical protein VTH82DRAFT_707 [Thermothelomyces myriococcoides]